MYLYGPLYIAEQRQGGQLTPTYSSPVKIRGVALRICRKRRTIEKGGERESGIPVLMVPQDDDDDEKTIVVVFILYHIVVKKNIVKLNNNNTNTIDFKKKEMSALSYDLYWFILL